MSTFQPFSSLLAATLLLAQAATAQFSNFFAPVGAGASNTTGFHNTFVGANAGRLNTSGHNNSLFGSSARLRNTTGSFNAFVGNLAGRRNTSGVENTFMGHSAGVNNITGNGNAYFGFQAGDNATATAFKALLPLTVTMVELNGNEKYADLPKDLPANASSPGTIQNGDLLLYGTRTLVLFYKSFSTSYSYTRIGRIDDPAGLAAAVGSGKATVIYQLE